MDAIKSVGYRIVSCRELSYMINSRPSEKLSGTDVSYQYGCSINVIEGNHISIKIMSNGFVKGEPVVKLESETVFEFKPFDAAFDISEEGRIVDRIGIMPTLFGLSYSSTRGMMAIRTAGTPLESFPLPIVDAIDVINKMQNPNIHIVEDSRLKGRNDDAKLD